MFNSFFAKTYEDLNGTGFKDAINANPDAIIIDVRTASEHNMSHIPNSVNIDIMSYGFHEQIAALDKNKTYFIYCRSGNRSGQACSIMSEMGFKTYNLAGGIGAWPNN